MFLSTRDDDNVVETPDYNNKEFLAITRGFNVFDVELFDDNDFMNLKKKSHLSTV